MNPPLDTPSPRALQRSLARPGWRRAHIALAPDADDAQSWRRWLRPLALAAIAISLLVHLGFWFLSTFILVGRSGTAGSSEGGSGPVEFAVISQTEFDQLTGSGSVELDTPAVPEAISSDPIPHELMSSASSETADLATGLGGIGPVGGGGDIGGSGSDLGTGGSGLGGSGGGSGASFFGVEARGNRFAYIVDVSASMQDGGRIEALRTRLRESIDALAESTEFIVLPFSTDSKVLGSKKAWTKADLSGKRWAREHVPLLAPEAGTRPLPAFTLLYNEIRPRADAIYFMTDGAFEGDPEMVAAEIARMNNTLKIPIHCICFETKDSVEIMKKISATSKGTFRFVSTSGGPP